MTDYFSKPDRAGTILWKTPVEFELHTTRHVAEVHLERHDRLQQLQDDNEKLSSQLREALIEIRLLQDLIAMRSL
jgi:hypothetical protein